MLSNSIIVLSSYLAAIVLDAASDATRDNSKKTISHILEGLMIAVFLSTPFTFNADVSQIGWYIAPYLLLRVGLFDPIYNKLRKLSICYRGKTSLWDKFVNLFKPPCWAELVVRVVALATGTVMILQNI